jgi:chloramphenicol 3-O-phosphotransferase
MHEVARVVADELGFALVDEQIVLRAAAEAGVSPDVVASAESRQSFMERALGAFGTHFDGGTFAAVGVDGMVLDTGMSDDLRLLIRAAIEETAERGSTVIVAHAASHALASRPDVLRILVTASHEVRCARVAEERQLSERDAEREVDSSDAARVDYFKRFYGEKRELPTHYDLVLNTDRLSPDEAAALVVAAATR